MLKSFIRCVDTLNEKIGIFLSWGLVMMTIITVLIVFLSFVFSAGWIWLNEIVIYLHGILFTCAAAYAYLHDEHIRIDVFYARLSKKGQAWINLIGIFLLLIPSCIVILIFTIPYIIDSWMIGETSSEGQGLPAVFLLKTCLAIMPILLILQGLSIAAKSWLEIVSDKHSS